MREAKFTPGPYQVLEDEGGGYASDSAECKFSIEAVGGMHLAVIIGDEVPEHKANARLFAAAPALYEALEAIPCRNSRYKVCPDNVVDMCDRCAALTLATKETK